MTANHKTPETPETELPAFQKRLNRMTDPAELAALRDRLLSPAKIYAVTARIAQLDIQNQKNLKTPRTP